VERNIALTGKWLWRFALERILSSMLLSRASMVYRLMDGMLKQALG